MSEWKAIFFGTAIAMFVAGSASAATTYTIDATSPFREDFSVAFEDADGNKELTVTEIVAGSFTGIIIGGFPFARVYDKILDLPFDLFVDPVTLKHSGADPNHSGWTFGTSNQPGTLYWTESAWSYTVTSDAAPIPLPAAGWMLLGALGGAAAYARKRKQAA